MKCASEASAVRGQRGDVQRLRVAAVHLVARPAQVVYGAHATSWRSCSGAQKRAVRSASSSTPARGKSTCGVIVSRGPSIVQLATTRPSTVSVVSPESVSFSGWTSGGMIRSRSA